MNRSLAKKTTKISSILVLVAGVLILGISQVEAANTPPGQIEGGNSNYLIDNLTTNSGFANSQTAQACDKLEYRLFLYNPGPGNVAQVNVEAAINTMTPYTSYDSTATTFTPSGLTPQTNFDATVHFATPETQSYIAGSTELLNSAGDVIATSGSGGSLPDTITMGAGGINIGALNYSVAEYVQFEAQVNCPTPTPTPTPTPAVPKQLVNTGPGTTGIVAAAVVTAIASAIGFRFYTLRRLSR